MDLGHGPRQAVQWLHKRNCSMTPRQLFAAYLSLCAITFVIAAGFWLHGATVVVAFAGLELAAVAVAMLVYARHAADREILTLAGDRLAVERHVGPRVERLELPAARTTVEPVAGQNSLIRLSAHGQTMDVGRFLRPEVRSAFAQELRRALRRTATEPEQPIRTELE